MNFLEVSAKCRQVSNNATGYLYLRHHKGIGYCFGRCKNLKQRNSQYKKPNPLIARPIDAYHTRDMFAAEKELKHRLVQFRLYSHSDEWAKEHEYVLEMWSAVKHRHRWRGHVQDKYFPFVRQVPLDFGDDQ